MKYPSCPRLDIQVMRVWLQAAICVRLLLLACPHEVHAQSAPVLHGVTAGNAQWCDLDHDPYPDLLVAGIDSLGQRVARLLRSDSANQFIPLAHPLPGAALPLMAWADVDGNGWDDLLYGGELSEGVFRLALYHNVAGVLTLGQKFSGAAHGCLEPGDFDNDGDQDFFFAGFHVALGRDSYWLENMGGVLQERRDAMLEPLEGAKAEAGDMDGDGDLDLVVVGLDSIEAGFITVYENLGGWQFQRRGIGIRANAHGNASWGDFDHDGDLDLAVCGAMPDVRARVLRNNGGVFSDTGFVLDSVHIGEVRWVDSNQDSWLDLVLTGMGRNGPVTNSHRSLLGAGFTPAQPLYPLPGIYNSTIDIADFNTDGHPDFIVTGQDSGNAPRTYIFKYQPSNSPARYGN